MVGLISSVRRLTVQIWNHVINQRLDDVVLVWSADDAFLDRTNDNSDFSELNPNSYPS